MRKVRFILRMALGLARGLIVGLVAGVMAGGCQAGAPEPEGLEMSETGVTLDVGETVALRAATVPAGAREPELSWTTSDKLVATVDAEGTVRAVGAGAATVEARDAASGFAARCRVAVREPGRQEVPLDPGDRWADTGVNVPPYPAYVRVANAAEFPRVELWTESLKPVQSKTNWERGYIAVYDPMMMYSDEVEVPKMPMKIRGRGNTTWEGPEGKKNPYRIKLEAHTKLLGMTGDKDWILLSDRFDPSLMRTALAMRISRLASMPWTPKFRIVELYLNGAYAGMYYLMEQKEVDRENKVPITVAPNQTASGYLLELDNKSDEDRYFRSKYFKKKIKFKDPDPNEGTMSAAQQQYITEYCETLEQKLTERAFTGADTYRDYIELDTWVRQFIVQELTMNIDGNMRLSTYFAKDTDTKLFIPFCWDFDRAFGNASYMVAEFRVPETWPKGWFVRIRGGDESDSEYSFGFRPTWYQYMFEDPVFVARVKELWELYRPRFNDLPVYLDKMADYCRPALDHNGQKFGKNHASAIASLRKGLLQRLEWMDEHIRALEPQRYNPATGAYEDLN